MEYSMIILDNSDYSRNGDYISSRWEAQIGAALLIANNKIALNQENAVGFITSAGQQPTVLLTPTNEDIQIKGCLHDIKQSGQTHLKNALAIAYLALKHRKNIHARQRITAFVASPVAEDEKTLVKFAKQLKKNQVAVDLVNIGQMDEAHVNKLQKFIENVNSSDNSHFKNIEPGVGQLEDHLIGTPFFGGNIDVDAMGGGVVPPQAGGGGAPADQFAEWGGINPQDDPELAEVMRQSILENAEQERKHQQDTSQAPQQQPQPEGDKMEEEVKQSENKEENLQEDIINRAQEITENAQQPQENMETEEIQDKAFMDSLLDMIPGLNKDDPAIQEALKEQQQQQQNQDKKDDQGEDKSKDQDKK